MKGKRGLRTFGVSGTVVSAIAFLMGSSGMSSSAANNSQNMLTIATTAAVTSFDPMISSSTEVGYMANAYEGLTHAVTQGPTSVVKPELATHWSVSKDGLVWTFWLQKGVHFHDGSLMTGKSVANAINKTISINQGSAYIWAPVKKVVASGQYQVKFYLKYSAPIDRIASAEYGAWIVGPKGLSEPESWFNAGHDDGTGPYTVSVYKPGQQVVMKAFPGYWGGWKGPHYTTIINNVIPQSSVQQQMIVGGQADIATAIQPQSLAALKSMPNLNVSISPSFYWYNAFFNTRKKPLKNPLVRQALSLAMPYDAIVKVGTAGYGRQLQGPLPYGQYPHDPSLPVYHYDLAKAKALLSKAGYPHGGFNLSLTYAAENPEEALVAPLIKESYAKLGVGVTIKPILFNEQWALAKGNPLKAQDIFLLLDWPTYSDSSLDLQALYHSEKQTVWNLSYYDNSSYDSIITKAQNIEVTNQTKAQNLFNQAQQILYKDVPAAWLYQDATEVVLNRSVLGYQGNPCYPFVISFYPLHPQT